MSVYFLLGGIILIGGLLHIVFRLMGEDEKGELGAFTFQLLGAIFFVPFLEKMPPFSSLWIYPILAGCFYGLGSILMLKAYSAGEVSLLAPLSNLDPLLVFLFAVIFLGESVSFYKLLAILFIFFGLANLKKEENPWLSFKALFSDKACRLYFLFLICFSLAGIIDKKAVSFFPLPTYAFIQFFLPSLFALFYIIYKKEAAETKKFVADKFLYIFLAGFITFLRYFSFLKVIALSEISWASPIMSTSTLLALIMSRLFLKEKLESRFTAAILIVIGAIILIIKV